MKPYKNVKNVNFSNFLQKRSQHIIKPTHVKGGVQAFQFRKHDFDLWVGGGGLDMF